MKKLNGKVAIVTGASKGIGAEIAKQFGAAGASVVVNYASSKAGADKVVGEITKAGGKAVAVQADVSKKADVDRLFAEAIKAFGKVDSLVNNAGIYEFRPLAEIDQKHFDSQFHLNVLGLLFASQAAAKHFGPQGGSIINIGSVAGGGIAGGSVYSATKGAVDTITRALARELGARKIRVNAVNPGMVETEGTASQGITSGESEFRKQIEATTPLGRIGKPGDIAPAVVMLASDEASWITGELLYISGGNRV